MSDRTRPSASARIGKWILVLILIGCLGVAAALSVMKRHGQPIEHVIAGAFGSAFAAFLLSGLLAWLLSLFTKKLSFTAWVGFAVVITLSMVAGSDDPNIDALIRYD